MPPLIILHNNVKNIIDHTINVNSTKQLTLFSGGNFLAQIVMMIYTILVARSLEPTQMGIYSGLYAILGITFTFVNFGLDTWMLKDAHTFDSIKILSGKIFSTKLLFGSVFGLLCLFLLPILRPNIFSYILVLIAILDILCDSLFNTLIYTWSIQRNVRNINIMLLISRFGKLALLFLLIFLNKQSPTSIAGTRLIISLLVLIASTMIIKPIIRRDLHNDIIKIIKRSSVFGLSEIFAMIYANIDIAILAFFSISATGLYSPASGIIRALFVIPNSIYVFLIPKYSKQLSEDPIAVIRTHAKKIILIFLGIGVILSLSLIFGSQFLVTTLLGQKYYYTGQLLTILSPILLFKSISFGLALILVITNNQSKRLLTQFIIALLNIIFNLLLIPYWGVMAVAWVYLASEILLMIGYGVTTLKLLKESFNLDQHELN